MKGTCTACKRQGIVDRAHLKTRGAGATWEPWEWLPLCRAHHVEQGQVGWKRFTDKFPSILGAVEQRGWVLIEIQGVWKLRREG